MPLFLLSNFLSFSAILDILGSNNVPLGCSSFNSLQQPIPVFWRSTQNVACGHHSEFSISPSHKECQFRKRGLELHVSRLGLKPLVHKWCHLFHHVWSPQLPLYQHPEKITCLDPHLWHLHLAQACN